MAKNIFIQLVQAYKEEGYDVSVGLNPWRESPDGSFAILIKKQATLKNVPDRFFEAPKIPYIDPETPIKPRFFPLLRKSLINSLKRNQYTRILFSDPVVKEDQTPVLLSSMHQIQYLDTGGGIAIDEIYFFDTLIQAFKPKHEFLIGVAAGWSTLAFGLMDSSAKLYGIDNLTEGAQAQEGLKLTRKLAEKLKINLEVFVGSSPKDVPQFLQNKEKMDFVFIDGLHTNAQVFLDFQACLPFVAESSILAFHDVLNWKMLDGWNRIVEIAQKSGFQHQLLRRTSSGIGILYRNVNKEVEDCIHAFSQDNRYPSRGSIYTKLAD